MTPLLKRIKIATIAVPDLDEATALYKQWLGYKAIAQGKITADHARLWGAAAMTGRRFATMQPASKTDVYIRAVEIDRVANYRPMTTWGWNAVEVIAEDPEKLHLKLAKSPFYIVGKPRRLKGYPTICATQVRGPGNEILYLTADLGNPGTGLLPKPGAAVGRPFIMVVASGNITNTQKWYCDTFKMKRNPINGNPVDIIQTAQGLPPSHEFPLTVASLAEHGNLLEMDGYPALTGPRPCHHGQLPPGVAMTSFGVKSLEAFKLKWLSDPVTLKGPGYEGKRAACVVGPAGEILELIEE
ncbi:MAG: VOC family protein [Rhodospirillaceae bacterium]|nr:VOC family protein [Rhodospirillaceae bacterium]